MRISASARLIVTRARVEGLVVFDHWHRRDEAFARLAAWHAAGHIQFREDFLSGFDRVPEAYVRMMARDIQGKQLVRL